MIRTIILTSQSKRMHYIQAQLKVYVTRTYQRCPIYKTERFGIFGCPKEISDQWINDPKKSQSEYWNHLNELKYTNDEFINTIQRFASYRSVLLLCFCENPALCHRVVLAEWLINSFPNLFIAGEFL